MKIGPGNHQTRWTYQPAVLWLIPSRGRPEQLARLHEQLQLTCTVSNWVFAIDDNDPELQGYLANGVDHSYYYLGEQRGLAGTTNMLAKLYGHRYEALGSIGDDHWPITAGWDLELFRTLVAGAVLDGGVWDGIGWAYPDDMLQGENLATAVLAGRRGVELLGYYCAPGMDHLMVDVAWMDLGSATGRLYYRDDVQVEHRHPAAGKAPDDAGYRENNSSAQVERDAAAYHAWVDNQLELDVRMLETCKGVA